MGDAARRLAAEFVGTAFLLAGVVGSGVMAERLTDDTALALWANTAATGAILVVLIATLGPVSGAHFNPAVTFAMLLRRRIGAVAAFAYVLVQILGGFGGVAAAHAMFEEPLVQFSAKARTGEAQWFAEAVATFGLVFFIFLAVRVKPDAVAWVVGLYIAAAYWFTASTSFANPAVTAARAFTDTFSGIRPIDAPMFIAAQIAGAAAATLAAAFVEPPKRAESA
jgi:glycerol uptake facilitator-like aquaporin